MDKKLKTVAFVTGITFFIFLTIFILFLISNENLKAKFIGLDSTHLPTIQVRGEGVVYAVPDVAEISFTVLTEGEDAEKALDENNQKMNSVINYLKEEGVDEKNIQTSGFNVFPLQSVKEDLVTRERRTEIYGYQVRNTVRVELEEMEKADTVIDGAVRAGANEVSSLRFVVSSEEDYKAEARSKAVEEARKKGEETASALGVSLKRVVDFSEDTFYFPYAKMEMSMADDGAVVDRTPIEAGENEIKVSVTVRYEIR